ncbi:MAG TPA: hypothetical protein VFH17_06570 [Coriobacteriia bacterium]|nr:hypothetical protein [Coriobacteriia bacterium]
MHGEISLTPFAVALGYFMRFVVPAVCAVITVDAGRRGPDAVGPRARIVWIALSLTVLAGHVAGLLWPDVAAFGFLAVVSVPLVLVMVPVYLLAVVVPARQKG